MNAPLAPAPQRITLEGEIFGAPISVTADSEREAHRLLDGTIAAAIAGRAAREAGPQEAPPTGCPVSALAFTGWDAGAVRFVLHHMRPMDAKEAFALQPHDDPDRLFAALVLTQPHMAFAEVAWRSLLGRPMAVLAIAPSTPRVGEVTMVATPEMRAADFRAWRDRLRVELPGICRDSGIRRLQARALSTHRAAHRFLRACGWRCEGVEEGLGRDGQDFQRWVALARDFPADPGTCAETQTDLSCLTDPAAGMPHHHERGA